MVLALRAVARAAGAIVFLHASMLCGAPAASTPTEADAARGVAWASESDVLAQLSSLKEDASVELLRLCVRQSWWRAVRELISRGHANGAGASLHQEVKTLLTEVKRSADEFGAFAEETYRDQTQGLDEVHSAVQWSQNSTTIFIGVKYAARWSAPGAIEVVDIKVNITNSTFELEGFGHHSSIRKRYVVNLTLYEAIVPERSSWSAASVGRLTATLQKAKVVPVVKWPRLLQSKDKHAYRGQIGTWLDMQEKWESELRRATGEEVPKDKKDDKKDDKKAKDNTSKKGKTDDKSSNKQKTPLLKKTLRKWWRLLKSYHTKHRAKILGVLGVGALMMLLSIAKMKYLGPQPRKPISVDVRERAAEAAQARSEASSDESAAQAPAAEVTSVGTDDEGWTLMDCCGANKVPKD